MARFAGAGEPARLRARFPGTIRALHEVAERLLPFPADHTDFIYRVQAVATTEGLPLILVLPDAGFDGDGGGWFADWFNARRGGAPDAVPGAGDDGHTIREDGHGAHRSSQAATSRLP
mgnify:CR=1 FL=1